MSLLLAAVHLVALVFGVATLVFRANALMQADSNQGLRRVFFWDNMAGLNAVFWVGSGLARAFGGFEKGEQYYLSNHVFWLKMLLVLAFVGVELVPLIAFARWRGLVRKRVPVPLEGRARLVRLHWVELGLIPLIVICAASMARGVGVVHPRRAASTDVRVSDSNLAGQALYARNCSACHQLDGRGLNGRLAANFVDDATRLAKSDAQLLHSIDAGVPNTAMVGFNGRLTADEQKSVLAYIRATFGPTPR